MAEAPESESQLTIDELARRSGMTVRNVRAHQSRGLIPPPEIRGRTGFYGPEHVARLEMIRDLQAERFSLGSIRRLQENTAVASAPEVLDFPCLDRAIQRGASRDHVRG